VICEEMLNFSTVANMVCVKMMAKAIITAIEHRPPFADLNSGFYRYLSSSVVLNRSQTVTIYVVFFRALLNVLPIINDIK
jgi:hypothetical protein